MVFENRIKESTLSCSRRVRVVIVFGCVVLGWNFFVLQSSNGVQVANAEVHLE